MSRYKPFSELTKEQRKSRLLSAKKYYETNSKKIIERQEKYRIMNKGKIPSLTSEKAVEYAMRSYKKRMEDHEGRKEYLATKRAWEKQDREKNGEKKRRYFNLWSLKLKTEVMNAYGGKCACCGETELLFLSIDHINNDGAEKRKNGEPTGATLYAKLKRLEYPREEYQVLCMNCNFAKGMYGFCPHQIQDKVDVVEEISDPGASV
jgi:hypothetical protein